MQRIVMSFTVHFYTIVNLCLVAQQNISFGWGRISLIEVAILQVNICKMA